MIELVRRRVAIAGLFLLLMPIVAFGAPSQQLISEVLATISKYESPISDNLTPAIKEIGFIPENVQGWNSLPPEAKLNTVYSSAENSAPSTGKKALAAIVDKLSTRYNYVRLNKDLQSFRASNGTSNNLTFAYGSKTLLHVEGPVAETIEAIAGYTRLGRAYDILTVEFSLTKSAAASIIASAKNTEEALIRGYGSMLDVDRNKRLLKAVLSVEELYGRASLEPAFVEFKRQMGGGGLPGWVGDDPIGNCYCGGRFVGKMHQSQCPRGEECL